MYHVNVSIVVSVYNEEEMIRLFWEDLNKVTCSNKDLFQNREVLFINDGSTDNSALLLDEISAGDSNVTVIHLSRNFGHEAAMYAGISYARGDAVICMDSDLQHPPSCLINMIEEFNRGVEVVTMKRKHGEDEGFIKRFASQIFYRIINGLSDSTFEPNASDFFLISKRVAGIVVEQYGERTRFLRGLIQTVGFKKTSLDYVSPGRQAGTSKYPISRLFFLSLSAIASFSHIPLRLGLGIGVLFGLFSFIIGAYSLVMHFFGDPWSGYTTIVVLLSLGFSLLFIIIGIIGEYIGYLFNEVKQRPLFITDRISEPKAPAGTGQEGDKQ
jgi:polyisoprenyl-phosphate glycosyltransferase